MINLIVEENIDEAFWKLSIPDLPPIFIEAGAKGEVKANMRKKLKTSVVKELEIERVSRTDMIKKYRELSQGKDKDDKDGEEVDEDMSTASDVDMNPTGGSKRKKKCETFSVSDDCFNKFKNGKIKFERWSKYLDLTDESQKKVYDWAKRHHNGSIILKNSQTGQVRGIRYNRTGGGQWGTITRLKEQVLKTNQEFTVK
jgi:hypothetical protein